MWLDVHNKHAAGRSTNPTATYVSYVIIEAHVIQFKTREHAFKLSIQV